MKYFVDYWIMRIITMVYKVEINVIDVQVFSFFVVHQKGIYNQFYKDDKIFSCCDMFKACN